MPAQNPQRRAANGDLYGLLGVSRDATTPEIRHAYRRLARRHHPDLNPHPDGPRQFAALTAAYEVLHDPAQRAHYDRGLNEPAMPAGRARGAFSSPEPPPSPQRRAPGTDRVTWGILELSLAEASDLTRGPLVLRDAYGRTFAVPAGTRDGDRLTLRGQDAIAVLTVRMPRTP